MVLTRQRNVTAPVPPPICSHCGDTGHIPSVCPHSNYLPNIPSLTCTACIRTCRSGFQDEPDSDQIVVSIDPCNIHACPVVCPPRPTQRATVRSFSATSPSTVTPSVLLIPPPPPPVVPGVSAASSSPSQAATNPSAGNPGSSAPTAPPPYTPATNGTSSSVSVPAPPPYSAAPPSVPAPQPGPVPSSRPIMRTFSIPGIVNEYDRVMSRVNNGSSLAAALDSEGLSVSFFSRKRVVAEASKVDMAALQSSILQLRNITLKNVFPLAAAISDL